ncbi:MAG: hypothetical protein FJZ47_08360 [Candidatus Tectomicrobia bacterium]|uniref:Uncharacterized protein n=1 Tax=Tectimicrobiota bacterium TaxID=2528274 RepID=A0A937W248_UNCTE|nr:hypothetical protein [Candidatus Tectomicrobia bacterium]
MTIYELQQWLAPYESWIGLGLVGFPCVTYILGALLRACARPLARAFLALAVFVVVLPGVSVAVLLLYMLLVARINLMQEINLVLHVLPVLSMVGTLWSASRLEDLDTLPGIPRLQGLVLLVALTCAGLLALHKTYVHIYFFASIEYLLVALAGFVMLWQFGVAQVFKKPRP